MVYVPYRLRGGNAPWFFCWFWRYVCLYVCLTFLLPFLHFLPSLLTSWHSYFQNRLFRFQARGRRRWPNLCYRTLCGAWLSSNHAVYSRNCWTAWKSTTVRGVQSFEASSELWNSGADCCAAVSAEQSWSTSLELWNGWADGGSTDCRMLSVTTSSKCWNPRAVCRATVVAAWLPATSATAAEVSCTIVWSDISWRRQRPL